jgi:hypothetical protein
VIHYYLYSCSRNILKGYSLINTLKSLQTERFQAFCQHAGSLHRLGGALNYANYLNTNNYVINSLKMAYFSLNNARIKLKIREILPRYINSHNLRVFISSHSTCGTRKCLEIGHLEAFLRYQSRCSPLEYRGSSY